MPREEYKIDVSGKHTQSRTEYWTWYGQMKGRNKVLHNHNNYAADTELLMNENNEIVDGYSYVFNDGNSLAVTKIIYNKEKQG